MHENFRAKVFDRRFFAKPDVKDALERDISMVRRVVDDSGKVYYRADRNASGHADGASALVLAVQAAKDFKMNGRYPVPFGGLPSRF